MNSPQISEVEIALAYSRLFRLLSDLFLNGVTTHNLGVVQSTPPLAKGLAKSVDLEATAADHQHLFGFNIFPYESAFLDPSGLLGGSIADGVVSSCQQGGFQAASGSEAADHLGVELSYLAYLNRHIADSWADGDGVNVRWLQDQAAAFIDDHIFQWLAPFVISIKRQEDQFYSLVADLTLDSVGQLRGELGLFDRERPSHIWEQLNSVTEFEELKQLAATLLTPLHCGIFLGRDDIGRLSQRVSLPRGFGPRRHMIENLFQAAAAYDEIPALLSLLTNLLVEWDKAYQQLADRANARLQTAAWRSRVEAAIDLFRRIKDNPPS